MDVHLKAIRRNDAECVINLCKPREWAAQYSSNGMFLSLDGIDVSAFWTGTTGFKTSNSPVDISAGANETHEQLNPGQDKTDFTVSLKYDALQATRATIIAKLKSNQKYNVIFGPQGNTAGMPVHEQEMLLVDTDGPNTAQDKSLFSTYALTFRGADAPVRNLIDNVFT